MYDCARCNTQLAEQQLQQFARGLTCLSLARPRNAHVQNLWISQCSCLCASALLSHCSQGTAAESQRRWLQMLSCPHTPHGSQQPACIASTMPVRRTMYVCTPLAVLRHLCNCVVTWHPKEKQQCLLTAAQAGARTCTVWGGQVGSHH